MIQERNAGKISLTSQDLSQSLSVKGMQRVRLSGFNLTCNLTPNLILPPSVHAAFNGMTL